MKTLLFLLQTAATNVNDITFGAKDVGLICGGLLSVAGTYFWVKYQIEKLTTKLADNEKKYEEEKGRLAKATADLEKALDKRVNDLEQDHKGLKGEIFKALDSLKDLIQKVQLEILQKISENKK